MLTRLSKLACLVGMAVAAAAAHAVTFYNVIIQSSPLATGANYSTNANSISFFTPNAIVGDGQALRAGTLNIQYDAFTAAPAYATAVGINIGTALSGSGRILFQEQIFELDANNNEVPGGPIGVIGHTFLPGGPTNWSGTITLSRHVERFRVKKFFTLSAVDTPDFDIAAIGLVNQNVQVVPEPGTLAALALGAIPFARRRRHIS